MCPDSDGPVLQGIEPTLFPQSGAQRSPAPEPRFVRNTWYVDCGVGVSGDGTSEEGTNSVVIDITANAFLLHMVRNITGSLWQVGQTRQQGAFIQLRLADQIGAPFVCPNLRAWLLWVGPQPA